MCFSASASFASSALLAAVGVAGIARSQTAPQRFLTAMPFLFSFQQLCEGVIWLSVHDAGLAHYQKVVMYAFLIMAQAGWPLFIPFSVLLLEHDFKRKRILKWFAGAGVLAAVYYSWCLLNFDAYLVINPYHIRYELDFPLSKRWFYGILYFIPAVFPTFLSGNKLFRALGMLLLSSYLISMICYRDYIVSVWCFFGALSSITALFIINKERAENNKINS